MPVSAYGDDEGHPNGRFPNGRLPWFAKLGLYLISNVAPLMLVLIAITALVTGWLPFPVLTTMQGVYSALVQIDKRLDLMERSTSDLKAIFQQTLSTQRNICYNTARSDDDKKRCFP